MELEIQIAWYSYYIQNIDRKRKYSHGSYMISEIIKTMDLLRENSCILLCFDSVYIEDATGQRNNLYAYTQTAA